MTRQPEDDHVRTATLRELAELSGRPFELIHDELRLREDLNLDSLAALEAVVVLEERYGLEITDAELAGLRSVGDLVRTIGAAVDPASPAAHRARRGTP